MRPSPSGSPRTPPFPAGFPATASSRASITSLNDEPVRLTPHDRAYRSRLAYTISCPLPAQLCSGYGPDHLDALLTYLSPTSPARTDT
ncbi:hypothetical protein AB0D71_15970 [Streptomyces avermitilis]|uniref:hypothetical protein n=1 Tax=Streptomyces avermitilis TaxID=33903 RepID=UPI0033EAE590